MRKAMATQRGGTPASGHTCEACKRKIRRNSPKAIFLYMRHLSTDTDDVELYVCGPKCLATYNEGEDV